MTTARALDSRPRYAPVDALRGVAVALMVGDHALFALGAPWWTRYGPTRLALPLFGIVAGLLWSVGRIPSWERLAQLAAGSVFVLLVARAFWPAFGWPDPLALWVLAGVAAPLVAAYPLWTVVVCVLWVLYGPQLFPANVYDPLLVVAYAGLGVLAGDRVRAFIGSHRWAPTWATWLGRHALGVYVGHIAILGVAAGVLAWSG